MDNYAHVKIFTID